MKELKAGIGLYFCLQPTKQLDDDNDPRRTSSISRIQPPVPPSNQASPTCASPRVQAPASRSRSSSARGPNRPPVRQPVRPMATQRYHRGRWCGNCRTGSPNCGLVPARAPWRVRMGPAWRSTAKIFHSECITRWGQASRRRRGERLATTAMDCQSLQYLRFT